MPVFTNAEEYPISQWLYDVVDLIKIKEMISRKEAQNRFFDNAEEYLAYYWLCLTPEDAFHKFWGEKM